MLITHESDIAAFAGRVVRLRDGHILSDVRQVPHEPATQSAPEPAAAPETAGEAVR